MADLDKYETVIYVNQPAVVITQSKDSKPEAPKPQPSTGKGYVDPVQAGTKARKELDDVRKWWADLPESEKQTIREKQFPSSKKTKEKPKPKPKEDSAPAAKEKKKIEKYNRSCFANLIIDHRKGLLKEFNNWRRHKCSDAKFIDSGIRVYSKA
jgi:hypothetical protein